MARYLVDPGLYDPENRHNSTASSRAEVVRIRDVFRSVLDPDTNQTNWQVSDVFTWPAYITGEGHGFVVYHMDGGAPSARTGPAWLFMWPGFYSTSVLRFDQITSANRNNYFRDAANITSFSTTGQMAIHYNPTATTTPYDIGLAADGSLTGGDHDAPTTSPYSNIDGFMPAGQLYGVVSSSAYGMTTNGDAGTRFVLVFDDQKPFVSMYHTSHDAFYIRGMWVLGEIIVPYRAADVYTSGVSFYNVTSDTSPQSVTHYVFDDTGTQIEVSDYYDNSFTKDNVPFGDGTYPWDVVPLASTTYYKGWLDSDIIRVMGPFARKTLAQFNNGEFIKFHEAQCFPYVQNQPSFPYPDPTDLS